MSQQPPFPKHPVRFVWLMFLGLSFSFAVCLLFPNDLPAQRWPLAFGYLALVPTTAVGLARLGARTILILVALASIPISLGIVAIALMFRSGAISDTADVWFHVSLYLFYALGVAALFLSAKGWFLYWKQTK